MIESDDFTDGLLAGILLSDATSAIGSTPYNERRRISAFWLPALLTVVIVAGFVAFAYFTRSPTTDPARDAAQCAELQLAYVSSSKNLIQCSDPRRPDDNNAFVVLNRHN